MLGPSGGSGAAAADSGVLATVVVCLLMVAVVAVGVLVAFVSPADHMGEPHMRWGPEFGRTSRDVFVSLPRPGGEAILFDEELFLGTLHGVRAGVGFHEAEHAMFMTSPGLWNTRSPLAYRQPLLTYVWLVLADGASIGVAWALLAAGAMLAAYVCARRFVVPVVAVLSPAGLCLVWVPMLLHPTRLLYTEMWAGPLAVTAAACCAMVIDAASPPGARRAWAWAWGGAVAALLAMLIRELAVAPVLVMALALLIGRETRARRLWAPWAGAIALWLAQYAWHASQVARVSANDPIVATGGRVAEYLGFRVGFFEACIRWAAGEWYIVPIIVVLCAMGALSALTVRSAAMRVLTGGLTAGVLAFLVFSGPPGMWPDGSYIGYWGYLFIPIVIAWSPLALRVVPSLRRITESPSAPDGDA